MKDEGKILSQSKCETILFSNGINVLGNEFKFLIRVKVGVALPLCMSKQLYRSWLKGWKFDIIKV